MLIRNDYGPKNGDLRVDKSFDFALTSDLKINMCKGDTDEHNQIQYTKTILPLERNRIIENKEYYENKFTVHNESQLEEYTQLYNLHCQLNDHKNKQLDTASLNKAKNHTHDKKKEQITQTK